MISLTLAKIPTLFIKIFSADDVQCVLSFVREACEQRDADNCVLFTDTPVTGPLVDAVKMLVDEGYRVVIRDHHGLEREPTSDRERQVAAATKRLRQLLGDDCTITNRAQHPACSTLIAPGEFKNALAIIADPDADGLTAAMKAAGICYPELDDDAAKLDGEPSVQVTGSPLSQLLAKNLATLPSYTPERPHEREQRQQAIFANWVDAVQGGAQARSKLEDGVVAYNQAVDVAQGLCSSAREVAAGVMLVDVIDAPTFDEATLMVSLEASPQCKVTVLLKNRGPIAALHGTQYSLAVAKSYKARINLQNLVPADSKNDPQVGIISNVSFLLHVNEDVWREHVLPALGRLT